MQKRTRVLLALLPLLAIMCRCVPGGFGPAAGVYTGIDGLNCKEYAEYFGADAGDNLQAREVLECMLTCPGTGNVVSLDIYRPEGTAGGPWTIGSSEEIYQTHCGAASPTSTGGPATAVPSTATTAATQTSQATETLVTVYPPLLSGAVTQCDLSARYINFRLLPEAEPASVQKLSLQLGGAVVPCGVSPGNASILTCALPQAFQYPASVLVTVDGVDVNRFEFDGAACVVVTPTKKDTGSAPASTAVPGQSPATPDCSSGTPDPENC